MKPAIIDIPGIGPAAAAALGEHRIKTLASLARAPVEKITAVPGFSEARAIRVIAAAADLLDTSATSQAAETETAAAGKQVKAGGKGKKDKKDKRKDKSKKGKKGKGKDKGKGKGKKKDKQ
ncbi:MAG: helix-hairpin-helix domain-containing protein [Gammaproteobacteria bacterium]|jgi:hypothetical protein